MGIDDLLVQCADVNDTVKNYASRDLSVAEFLKEEAKRAKRNREIKSLFAPDDYIELTLDYLKENLTDEPDINEALSAVEDSLKTALAVNTADHHGGIYCAQSFQVDILFKRILEENGSNSRYVPIFPTGIVELQNSTYARGICIYADRDEKKFLPIFPAKEYMRLACVTQSIKPDVTDRMRKIAREFKGDINEALNRIINDIYSSSELFEMKDFSTQTLKIGKLLSEMIFGDEGPVFLYIEFEELITELLCREMYDESSYVYKVLYDKGVRERLSDVAKKLFVAVDDKGRKIELTLSHEGKLIGYNKHKNKTELNTDRESLIKLLRERRLFPSTALSVIVMFFERGITWYGGMFQSLYLPHWQKELCEAFWASGYVDEAEHIISYDARGYICGPFACNYKAKDHLSCAGPVEFIMQPIAYDEFKRQTESVSMYDAHLLGLCEMYYDLIPGNERSKDWYRHITTGNYKRFIQDD